MSGLGDDELQEDKVLGRHCLKKCKYSGKSVNQVCSCQSTYSVGVNKYEYL